jgi:holliday junction DNA helicase RuvA
MPASGSDFRRKLFWSGYMISSLRGIVSHVGLNSAVVDVNGFGMLVQATPQTLATLHLGREAELSTTMIVREDSMTLYAFEDASQREVFETLISVSGVGPRLGLAALSVHTPEILRIAAAEGDTKTFSKVPGIGPKLASRMVLELAGKLVPLGEASAPVANAWEDQVLEALKGLGWTEKDAGTALDNTAAEHPEAAAAGDVAKMLRLTLRSLGQDGVRSGSSRRTAAGAR